MASSTEVCWSLWAKWSRSREPQTFHPLLCHLIDVAVVAETMWQRVLSARARRRLAAALGVDEDAAGRWIAFWAGLHDIGKAAPVFQRQIPAAIELLRAAGLTCPIGPEKDPRHGTISAGVLRDLLPLAFGLDADLASRIATIIGGHHGVFPSAAAVNDLSRQKERVGKGAWQRVRTDLAERLADALDLAHAAMSRPQHIDNASGMVLAGLVSVADWIGSNEDYFPHEARSVPNVPAPAVEEYMSRARNQAARALGELGWLDWPAPQGTVTFADLFPHLCSPHRVQEATETLARELAGIALVVIEAPMGEGKTESAFYLAEHWAATLGQGGHYIALPTQATSDQMFGRARDFLQRRYPAAADLVNLQLLHGHAALSGEFETLKRVAKDRLFAPEGIWGEEGTTETAANVIAAEWFTARKRGLLAPYGVGTVDQILLAVLQTRHVFVRLFGLGAKTVIIDEVHAYDTYMTTLLQRLLQWLGALGVPVALLSATLPCRRREALVRAYAEGAGWPEPSLPQTAYPRLTWASAAGGGARHVPPAPGNGKVVALRWVYGRLSEDPAAPCPLVERLQESIANGGCAAVICNTVGRAQQLYRALASHFAGDADDGEPVLDLLHARFLYQDREERERRVLRRFGKGARSARSGAAGDVRRPDRAILVATQIIEQSLDLDFDLLVTDLAPADLLLQRAGRLHRHDRPGDRPPDLRDPQLWIVEPEGGANGVPSFGRGNEAVYAPHLLLRSWLELRERGTLTFPDDIERVVEAVYDERDCPANLSDALREKWQETRQASDTAMASEEKEAERRYIRWPNYTGSLPRLIAAPREEEAPELHPEHQALTRLIEPTASLVMLRDGGEGLVLSNTPGDLLALGTTPDIALAKRLLQRSVTVSDRRIVRTLLAEHPPTSWRKSPLLNRHRLVILDQDQSAIIGQFRLQLSGDVGLEVLPAKGIANAT
jgi:CRISPR-associated endonuclease/helicase Cas3